MTNKNKGPTKKKPTEKKNKGGRPKIYTEAEVFQSKIDDYFDSITIDVPRVNIITVGYEDEEHKKPIREEIPVLNNKGEQIIDKNYYTNPSIIAMAHYIGMTRETLNQYKKDPVFSDAIKRAKEKIEIYLENELYRPQGQVTGIIFNLKNNFDWKDKTEVEGRNTNVNLDVELTVEEAEQYLKEQGIKL